MKNRNDGSLTGRTAVVTGAQQGIGRAIALALGAAGANVIAHYFEKETAAESLKEELAAMGVNCELVRADLGDARQIEIMFSSIQSLGKIDTLVNNAAMFPRTEFLALDMAMWQQTLDVNLTAPFLCSQHAARMMIEDKLDGSIINIVSGAAFRSSPRASHYVTSKAGLVGLTRASALELAPHSIRVNAVAPGLTDTAQPRIGMSEQELVDAAQLVPLGKIAEATDIAPVVCFLASSGAAHITGQTFHVNGGQYLA
jgi:3-oxoacyl-[acyl-carrier protein] reductase